MLSRSVGLSGSAKTRGRSGSSGSNCSERMFEVSRRRRYCNCNSSINDYSVRSSISSSSGNGGDSSSSRSGNGSDSSCKSSGGRGGSGRMGGSETTEDAARAERASEPAYKVGDGLAAALRPSSAVAEAAGLPGRLVHGLARRKGPSRGHQGHASVGDNGRRKHPGTAIGTDG